MWTYLILVQMYPVHIFIKRINRIKVGALLVQ